MPMLPQVKKEESPLLNEDKLNNKMQEVFNFYKNSINEPNSLTTKIDQTLKQADALLKYEPKDEKEKELYLKNLLFYKNYLQNLRSRLSEGYIVVINPDNKKPNKLQIFNKISEKIDLIESKIKNYQTIENYKDLDSYYSRYFDALEGSLIEDKGKKVFPFKNLNSFQELMEIVSNDNKTKYWKFDTKKSMEAFKQGLEELFEKKLIKNAPIISDKQNNVIGLNIGKETRKEIERGPKDEGEINIQPLIYKYTDIDEAKLVYGAKQALTYSRFFNPNQFDKTLLNKLAQETLNQFLTDNNTTLEEFKNKPLDEKKKLLSKFEVVGYATVESSKQIEENLNLATRRGELLRNAIVDLIAANEGEREDLKKVLTYRGELVSWFTIEGKVSSEKANKRLNAAIKALQNDSSLESQIALLILQGKYEEAKKEAKQKKDLDLVASINELQKAGGNPAITIDENGNASITNQALLEKILKRQDLGGLRYEEIMVTYPNRIESKDKNKFNEVYNIIKKEIDPQLNDAFKEALKTDGTTGGPGTTREPKPGVKEKEPTERKKGEPQKTQKPQNPFLKEKWGGEEIVEYAINFGAGKMKESENVRITREMIYKYFMQEEDTQKKENMKEALILIFDFLGGPKAYAFIAKIARKAGNEKTPEDVLVEAVSEFKKQYGKSLKDKQKESLDKVVSEKGKIYGVNQKKEENQNNNQ